MKWFFKVFFKTIRMILGPILLFADKLTSPKGVIRPPQEQERVDERTRSVTLYQFLTCPFCIKVRRAIKRLSLKIETRDVQRDPQSREQLLLGGGRIKVPCLRVTDADGKVTWLYESEDIVAFLEQQFA